MSFVRVQLRRGFAEEWEEGNPILAPGEIGVEQDNGKFKLGNGIDIWTDLPYAQATAYDLAVNNGFDGTEEEWLDSLAVNLSIASVQTVVYGEPAEAILGGVHPNRTLTFKIPGGQPGPAGPAGPQGPRGEAGAAGPTNITWQGVWSDTVDYSLNDAVYHDGFAWFSAVDPNIGHEPDESSTFWYKVNLNVVGEEGPQGPAGPPGPGVDNFSELLDVNIVSVQNGDSIIYDSATQKWIPGAPASNLNDLSDVNISSPANNDSLIYNSSTQTWQAGTTPRSLASLSDVNVTVPQNDHILMYNSSNSKWEPGMRIFVQSPTQTPTDATNGDLWIW